MPNEAFAPIVLASGDGFALEVVAPELEVIDLGEGVVVEVEPAPPIAPIELPTVTTLSDDWATCTEYTPDPSRPKFTIVAEPAGAEFTMKAETLRIIDPANPKDVAGAKKPDLTLLPSAGLLHMSVAMQLGATKYGPYNWREKKIKMKSYLSAAIRHVQSVLDGEDFDQEPGAGHHLGHAMATCAIVLDAMETGNLIDDRPAKGAAAAMIRYFNDNGTFEGRLQ